MLSLISKNNNNNHNQAHIQKRNLFRLLITRKPLTSYLLGVLYLYSVDPNSVNYLEHLMSAGGLRSSCMYLLIVTSRLLTYAISKRDIFQGDTLSPL